MQVELVNTGPSPAYDFIWETWIELLKFPFKDFTVAAEHATVEDRSVMYPNHAPLMINIPVKKGITAEQITELRRLKLYACFRVRIQYRDAFNPVTVANFGFYVMGNGLGYLPKHNDLNS